MRPRGHIGRDDARRLRISFRLMAKTSPVEFYQQVRQEVSRVTWPSRKETVVTTAMVFVMVFIAAAFFFVVDQVFSAGVRLIFGLGQ
jgi:preprotein translocase subunit SecE